MDLSDNSLPLLPVEAASQVLCMHAAFEGYIGVEGDDKAVLTLALQTLRDRDNLRYVSVANDVLSRENVADLMCMMESSGKSLQLVDISNTTGLTIQDVGKMMNSAKSAYFVVDFLPFTSELCAENELKTRCVRLLQRNLDSTEVEKQRKVEKFVSDALEILALELS